MGIETLVFSNDVCKGIVHYTFVDAVFKDENGRSVIMEFHTYCGPDFCYSGLDYYDSNFFIPDEDSILWKQFDGWWKAKGKGLYGNK